MLTDEISERTRVEQALRESEAQLRQSQKLEAIGTLAGGIAHDFNNLITVISGYTQLALMRADHDDAGARTICARSCEASDRAAKLTHQLLAFSRKQVLQPTVLDLGEVVRRDRADAAAHHRRAHRAAHRSVGRRWRAFAPTAGSSSRSCSISPSTRATRCRSGGV